MRVYIDYETRSEAHLRKVGAVSYAQHPSTEIICVAYAIEAIGKVKIWLPWQDEIPDDLRHALNNEEVTIIAHNALFEQVITKYVLRKYTKRVRALWPQRFKCTAAKAAACALPRNLEDAAIALKLPIKKDMEGNRLMKKHSKPRTPWKKWAILKEGPEPKKYFDDPKERVRIYGYSGTDVKVSILIDASIPDLTPFEQRVWVLNQEMNLRGVQIDVETVKRIQKWIGIETKRLEKKLFDITGGKVDGVNKRDAFIDWVRRRGVSIPNLQSETVTKLIEILEERQDPATANVIAALKIRQQVGRSSIKKYPAMLTRVSTDGRVKDYSMYHGASTGREAGRGLQLQNLVKGKIKNTDQAIEMVKSSTLDEIRMFYGDPFEVFSSCVRGMVTASPKFKMYVADYNAIEARVLQWLAGDEAGLNRFRNKIDSYVIMASKIYGIPMPKVTKDQREVGKRAELGCGFQMGGDKFYDTCLKYGAKDVTKELCKRAVNIFRESHQPIVKLWSNLENAAILATEEPGRVVKVNKTAWQRQGKFLWCQLPSGRKLAFCGPTVRQEPTPWGEMAPKLYHWGVAPTSRKWYNAATYGGKLTENVTQAVARDITVNAMLNLKSAGFNFLFMVHDEIISEKYLDPSGIIWKNDQNPKAQLAEYENILMTIPGWAKDLPITAKGWYGPRYKKA